ncbi:uncharacterized protein LOC131018917 [Salvia miltiorrhiza]|uniref:uncharacterized protein LOC131018917 n=1 Tax=Salvia miltiorrhiza TaxID=226208 RepID=UPI0025AC854D|nr:uncharacterized protein LOC131018917 [Salvia miltiorrhiza]
MGAFHAQASKRKKRDEIKKLRNEREELCEKEGGDIDFVCSKIEERVSQDDFELLTAPYEAEENETIIALIPKVDRPKRVAEFRPISMCNITYKIVSKVIVNRLRRVLDGLIDQAQSAFIKGRQITDNILISFECQHWLRARKKGFSTLKLDIMSKASVFYSFLLNKRVSGEVKPTRGLRQGDPLSSFLFVICAQGFSSLFRFFEMRGEIHDVPMIPKQPSITHLFFADDSLIFFKADVEEAVVVKEITQRYESASSQMINFDKSSITFSPNTTRQREHEIKHILNIKGGDGLQRYLGLPAFSMRKKRIQFGYLVEKIQKKLLSWNQREFSGGGKEVLIKAVIQAIPTYALQCFRLPDSICNDIDRITAAFWWGPWGDKEDKRCLHWKKWGAMCKPKEWGGLGFRDLKGFNQALVAKQAWRLMTNPETLVARVFRARYFCQGDFMHARLSGNVSFIWRSLLWSRPLIEKGMVWQIGDGSRVRIFQDSWVQDLDSGHVMGKADYGNSERRVMELIDENNNWNEEVLNELFWPHEKEAILRTPICEKADEYALWCMILHRIWCFVCELTHGKREDVQAPSVADCQAALEALQAAKTTFLVENLMGMQLGKKRWYPPRCGRYRCDVDALFDSQASVFGVGVVVRNSQGEVVFAAAKKTKPSSTPLLMEIMAVVAGIMWCIEYDFTPIEIFTDSMLAARVMACPEEEERRIGRRIAWRNLRVLVSNQCVGLLVSLAG